MSIPCPYCSKEDPSSEGRPRVILRGHFRRKSDSRFIQRFFCRTCRTHFSRATEHPAYNQKKRQVNDRLRKLLVSGVSLRRSAKLLNVSRTTVARKLSYLGEQAELSLRVNNLSKKLCESVEFDDLETFEHTKCKPLSITLAVEHGTRRILGFEVSQMAAKGKLTHIAQKKYGRRRDKRRLGRKKLFETLKPLIIATALIKSDENPHYLEDVKRHFPRATHKAFKGKRGAITGQGELKKIGFDPLFSLNHTCAMARANMNRLFRRTWCTTKSPEKLRNHFAIYADYHNEVLI